MIYFLLGSCLGSFLCVVAQRLPLKQDFIFSRSCCDHCRKTLRFWELIPIISGLFLCFHCKRCGKRISFISWLVEIIYGGIFYFCCTQSSTFMQFIALVWLTAATLLSLTDYFYFLVEPKILYPLHLLLWGGMFYFHQPFYVSTFLLLVILGIFFWFSLRDSMGMGDWLLLAFWVPWLTLEQFSLLLFVASLSALIVFLGNYLFRKQPPQRLPFVPFLSLGLFVAYFL